MSQLDFWSIFGTLHETRTHFVGMKNRIPTHRRGELIIIKSKFQRSKIKISKIKSFLSQKDVNIISKIFYEINMETNE